MNFSFLLLFFIFVAINSAVRNPNSTSEIHQNTTLKPTPLYQNYTNQTINPTSITEPGTYSYPGYGNNTTMKFSLIRLKDPDPHDNKINDYLEKYRAKYRKNYRRGIFETLLSEEHRRTHCIALITPVLEGIRETKEEYTSYDVKDHEITRLFHLVTTNVTTYEHQDLYALLYQISLINIRMFHWTMEAIASLLYLIDPVKKHTVWSLKAGLNHKLGTWLISYANTTSFMEKAHIIRPPCVVPNRMKVGPTIGHFPPSTRPASTFTKKKCYSKRPNDPQERDCEL